MGRLLRWGWWLVAFGRRHAWTARRDHRGGAFLLWTAAAAVGDVVALAWSLSVVLALAAADQWLAAAVALVLLGALMMRRAVIERVTIPVGLFRTTHLLAELDRYLGGDPPGLARLQAARALGRAGLPASADAWWKSIQPGTLFAHDLAAQAVLADARGDRADARALFESLALMREPAPTARELAAEWLALDDADAGRWQAIVDRAGARARPARGAHRSPDALAHAHAHAGGAPGAGEYLWPATTLTFFLEGVAGRLLGRADAPSQLALALRWLEAPRRRATWWLFRRAVAAGAPPATVAHPRAAGEPQPAAAPLAHAIALHTAALARPDEATLAAAAAAWDAAFTDASWRTAIAQRAITLGAPPDASARAVDELRAQVVTDVAHAILASGARLPALLAVAEGDGGGGRAGGAGGGGGGDEHAARSILTAAAARARAELLAGLELTFERIGGRVHDRAPLAAIDEWRSFLAVRAAYHHAARQGGVELERLAFPHAHAELTSWSVWLWNDRHEHAISHGMTTWLYEQALAVGDAQAIELHGKNARLEPASG